MSPTRQTAFAANLTATELLVDNKAGLHRCWLPGNGAELPVQGGGGIYTPVGRNSVHQWLQTNGVPIFN